MEKKGARLVAISTDDVETMRRFKKDLKAPGAYFFVADPDAKVVGQYDLKMPVIGLANRATFTVAQDGKVTDIKTGGDAIDPAGTLQACPLHKGAEPAKQP